MRRRSFLALTASLPLLPVADMVSAAQTPPALGDDNSLATLLGLLPETARAESDIRYANYAAQRAALGITETGADIDPDAWIAAMSGPMMIPTSMMTPLDPMWRDGLGFDLRDVDQMVEVGGIDTSILILTGQFDVTSLTAAWEVGGYAAVDTGGLIWHTLGADNVLFDPAVPLSDWHLGALSHLALLESGTVVGTAHRTDMEQVLALYSSESQSPAGGVSAHPIAAAPDNIAAGWVIDGMALVPTMDSLLSLTTNPNVAPDLRERLATQVAEMATEVAEEAPLMPPIAQVLLGIGAGVATPLQLESFPEGPKADAIVVIVPVDVANAEMVAETARRRLATLSIPFLASDEGGGQPYSEQFPNIMVEVDPSGAVVIELEPAPDVSAVRLIKLQQMGHLSLLFWAG